MESTNMAEQDDLLIVIKTSGFFRKSSLLNIFVVLMQKLIVWALWAVIE